MTTQNPIFAGVTQFRVPCSVVVEPGMVVKPSTGTWVLAVAGDPDLDAAAICTNGRGAGDPTSISITYDTRTEVPLYSDGTAVIDPNDMIGISATVDGAVMTTLSSSGFAKCTSLSQVPATVGALAQSLLKWVTGGTAPASTIAEAYIAGGGNEGTDNTLGEEASGMSEPLTLIVEDDTDGLVVEDESLVSQITVGLEAGGAGVVHTTGGISGAGVYNLYHYGAVGDGIADDSAAVAAWLAAVAANTRGGTAYVPKGKFRIATVIPQQNFADGAFVRFVGEAGESIFIPDLTTADIMLNLYMGTQNGNTCTWRGITFLAPGGGGGAGALSCKSVLKWTGAPFCTLRVTECAVVGVYSDRHMFDCQGGQSEFDHNLLMGIGVTTGYGLYEAAGVKGHFHHNTLLDLGEFDGALYSGGLVTFLVHATPMAPVANETLPSCSLTVEHCYHDEGVAFAVSVDGTAHRMGAVAIRDIKSQCETSASAVCVQLYRVNHAYLEDLYANSLGNAQAVIVNLYDVTNCRMRSIVGETSHACQNRITADNACGTLELEDLVLSATDDYPAGVNSLATQTFITQNGVRSRVRLSEAALLANTLGKPGATAGRVDQLGTADDARLALGVILDAASAAGKCVRVVEQSGQQVQLKSDGATTLTMADTLTSSGANAGRVKKTTTGGASTVGLSVGAATNVLDTLCDVVWQRGQY